jgi:hypothetical protein
MTFGIYTATNSSPVTYNLGDVGPAGGLIVYDAGSLQSWGRWIELAPENWDSWPWSGTSVQGSTDPLLQFRTNSSLESSQNTSLLIGGGLANTTAIALADTGNGACKIVDQLTLGGRSDWFVPSRDELLQIYSQKNHPSNPSSGYGFTAYSNTAYYTSSESSTDPSNNVWIVNMQNGGTDNYWNKGNSTRVRPARYVS